MTNKRFLTVVWFKGFTDLFCEKKKVNLREEEEKKHAQRNRDNMRLSFVFLQYCLVVFNLRKAHRIFMFFFLALSPVSFIETRGGDKVIEPKAIKTHTEKQMGENTPRRRRKCDLKNII